MDSADAALASENEELRRAKAVANGWLEAAMRPLLASQKDMLVAFCRSCESPE